MSSDHRHIETLRDYLALLESDAPNLYQYRSLGASLNVFNDLSATDQRRLIALALHTGDQHAQNVARHLTQKLKPSTSKTDAACDHSSDEDRKEIQLYCEQGRASFVNPTMFAAADAEIRRATEEMSDLRLETAVWIFIPNRMEHPIHRLSATGGRRSRLSAFKAVSQLLYEPDEDETASLFEQMRGSSFTLHLHNHPEGVLQPSAADFAFASYWKSRRPELATRMRFYIVARAAAVEYDGKGS